MLTKLQGIAKSYKPLPSITLCLPCYLPMIHKSNAADFIRKHFVCSLTNCIL